MRGMISPEKATLAAPMFPPIVPAPDPSEADDIELLSEVGLPVDGEEEDMHMETDNDSMLLKSK